MEANRSLTQNNTYITELNEQTIIAQATPTGSGAIALIRLSGSNVFVCIDQIARVKQQLSTVESHTIHYGSIVDHKGTIIDRVMFLVMRRPRTFTGQDTVEITCHNNQFIIQAIIDAAINAGARLAQAGEFTQRAVEHGKIDLLQAESIHELITAHHQESRKQALSQLDGALSAQVYDLEQQLLKALAFCNASYEFIDEEHLTFGHEINIIVNDVIKKITKLLESGSKQQTIREGIKLTLCGSTNVGKSSLFNALLGKERAIVSDIAGTTRDTIEAGIYTSDCFLTLTDTAGLRQTTDSIEQEGITRTIKELSHADIILLIYDHSIEMHQPDQYLRILSEYKDQVIIVANKTDLLAYNNNHPLSEHTDIGVSIYDHESIKQLRELIKNKTHQLLHKGSGSFLLNDRHLHLLHTSKNELSCLKDLLHEPYQYELIGIHLEQTLAHLSELTGKSISEKAMDQIFRQFCVGK